MAWLLLIAFFNTGYGQVTTFLFVGTYTDNKPDKGIYVFRMDPATGELTKTGTGNNMTNPSFLTVSPNGKYLYACTDTKTLQNGSVSSFLIDSRKGQIRFINKQSSEGANPVNLVVNNSNRFVIIGNYTGGSAAVLPLNADGSLQTASQTVAFADSGINKARQEKSHIHSAVFSADNRYLYLPDLGSDKIRVFSFSDSRDSTLAAMDQFTVHTQPGSGPRHMVFHPNQRWAYCIEEMGGTVSAYTFNSGRLIRFQRINANKKKAVEYSSADIHISPDGLFLYASNRVENTLAIFAIGRKGRLALIGHTSALGDVPRNFAIDPSGDFLLVANQASNNIVVFKRNRQTGLLTHTGYQVSVPSPSCLQMRQYGGQ